MPDDLKDFLNEITVIFCNCSIEPELLYSYLGIVNLLQPNEISRIKEAGMRDSQTQELFLLLKPKATMELLEEINKVAKLYAWEPVKTAIAEFRARRLQVNELPGQPKYEQKYIQTLRKKCEHIKKFWDMFNIDIENTNLISFNKNIKIEGVSKGEEDENVNIIEKLLERLQYANRILLIGGPGYGKSSIASEIARHWLETLDSTNVKNPIVEKLRKYSGGVFLLRREDNSDCLFREYVQFKCKSTEHNKEAADKHINDENTLFIVDGIDEINVDKCICAKELLFGRDDGGVPDCSVIFTSRVCEQASTSKLKISRNKYFTLKGFYPKGYQEHAAICGVHFTEEEEKLLKDSLVVPLHLAIQILQRRPEVMNSKKDCFRSIVDYYVERHKTAGQEISYHALENDRSISRCGLDQLEQIGLIPEKCRENKIDTQVHILSACFYLNDELFQNKDGKKAEIENKDEKNLILDKVEIKSNENQSEIILNDKGRIKLDGWFPYFYTLFNETFRNLLWDAFETGDVPPFAILPENMEEKSCAPQQEFLFSSIPIEEGDAEKIVEKFKWKKKVSNLKIRNRDITPKIINWFEVFEESIELNRCRISAPLIDFIECNYCWNKTVKFEYCTWKKLEDSNIQLNDKFYLKIDSTMSHGLSPEFHRLTLKDMESKDNKREMNIEISFASHIEDTYRFSESDGFDVVHFVNYFKPCLPCIAAVEMNAYQGTTALLENLMIILLDHQQCRKLEELIVTFSCILVSSCSSFSLVNKLERLKKIVCLSCCHFCNETLKKIFFKNEIPTLDDSPDNKDELKFKKGSKELILKNCSSFKYTCGCGCVTLL